MSTVWVASDLHLNHAKILGFEDARKHFGTIAEHDAYIIDTLHDYVRPDDTLLLLGDIYLGKDDEHFDATMKKLPGVKQLVMGNHDEFDVLEYRKHFERVMAYKVKYGMLFSHIPVHIDQMERWGKNVHGHLHSGEVTQKVDGAGWDYERADPRYLCVSLEQRRPLGRPFNIDEIRAEFTRRGV